MRLADDLHAHGQPARVKPNRDADARQAGKGGVNNHFHPSVVSVHLNAIDVLRPAQRGIKRPDLRRGQGQKVMLLEQRQQMVIERGALRAGGHQLVTGERGGLVVLPEPLGFDARAVLRVCQKWCNAGCHQRTPPYQPGLPHRLWRSAQPNGVYRTAQPGETRQALPAHVQNARLHRQVARQVAQPANLCIFAVKMTCSPSVVYIVSY